MCANRSAASFVKTGARWPLTAIWSSLSPGNASDSCTMTSFPETLWKLLKTRSSISNATVGEGRVGRRPASLTCDVRLNLAKGMSYRTHSERLRGSGVRPDCSLVAPPQCRPVWTGGSTAKLHRVTDEMVSWNQSRREDKVLYYIQNHFHNVTFIQALRYFFLNEQPMV